MNPAILDNLQGLKRTGNGWQAKCPAHDDKTASLCVSWGDDGRTLAYCQAGCTVEQICDAAGIRVADLFADVPRNGRHNGNGKREILSTYSYTDRAEVEQYQKVRFSPKDFAQRKPDGRGGWIWKLEKDDPHFLYRTPQLSDGIERGDPILFVEGEKDADTAARLGFVATTNCEGAGKWNDAYTEQLRGADIVLIPDNDEPGRAHVELVGGKLSGVAKRIRKLELPDLKPKGDLTDWVNAGGTSEQLRELIEAAPEWMPTAAPLPRKGGFQLTRLGDLLAEPTEATAYVVDGLLPVGGFSITVASPKVGKSILARNLALCVSRGEPFLGRATKQGPVVYLALEEKRSEVKRHFADMGATGGEPLYIHCAIAPQDAMAELQKTVEEVKPILIIIDTILKFVRVRDANDYAIMSAALEPVLHIARTTGAHVAGTHHSKKGDAVDGDAILGSQAIFGAVDTAILLKRCDHFRTVRSIQRYGDDLPETILDFDPQTRTVSLGELREKGETHRLQNEVLGFLSTSRGKRTQKEIEDNIEGRTATKRRAFRELCESGRVQKEGTGRRGDPFLYRVDFSPTREQGNKKPTAEPSETPNSLFVVPAHFREQGNKKRNSDVNGDENTTYSCSHVSGTSNSQGTRNEVAGTSNSVEEIEV